MKPEEAHKSLACGLFTKRVTTEEIDRILAGVFREGFLVSSGDKDNYNMMYCDLGFAGSLWHRKVAGALIVPTRYTAEFIEKTHRFVLSFFKPMYRDVIRPLGKKSGREMDKMHFDGLTPVVLESGDIAFAQATVTVVCKVLYKGQEKAEDFVDRQVYVERYQERGKPLHDVYIGEIEAVYSTLENAHHEYESDFNPSIFL